MEARALKHKSETQRYRIEASKKEGAWHGDNPHHGDRAHNEQRGHAHTPHAKGPGITHARGAGIGHKSKEAASGNALGAIQRPQLKKSAAKRARIASESSFDPFKFLREADIQTTDIIKDVVVVVEGLGNKRDKHLYGPEAVASCVPLLEGAKCFLDHSDEMERLNRPERSVKDLCGFYTNPRLIEVEDEYGRTVTAAVADIVPDNGQAGRELRAKAQHSRVFHRMFPGLKEVYCGTSIDADGDTRTVRMDPGSGTDMLVNYVDRIRRLRSADIVTRPARGGDFMETVTRISKARNTKEAKMLITEAQAREVVRLGNLLESARKAKNEKKVAQLLAESQKRISLLVEASKPPKGKKGAEAEDEDESETGRSEKTGEPHRKGSPQAKANDDQEDESESEDEAMYASEDEDENGADGNDKGGDTHVHGDMHVHVGKKGAGANGNDNGDAKDEDEQEDEGESEGEGRRSRMSASDRDLIRNMSKELKETKSELRVMKAQGECRVMLREAGIDKDILSVKELMAIPSAQRPMWLKEAKRWQAAKAASFGSFGNSVRGEMKESGDESDFSSHLRSKLAGRGIPVDGE